MSALGQLLARVRRRLRGLWLVTTVVWLAPLLAGVALALVLLGRFRPWGWTDVAAVAVVLAGLTAIAVVAIALRVPDAVAARAADRGLDTRDAFATALEREGADGPFDAQLQKRADDLSRTADLQRALPLHVRRRRLAAGVSLAAVAVLAGVAANPQDEIRRQRAAEQALIDEAAEAIEEAASEMGDEVDPPVDTAATLAELEALAAALAEASTIEEAEALLDRAEAALEAGLAPEALARKAALSGLEESLASEPLPGAPDGGDAAAQLEAAAEEVGELGDQEATDLAERLERLAETQAVGNPAAAAALGQAAAALRAGDASAASEALGEAAAAQQAAGSASAADDARRSALGAVGEARQRLAGRGEGSGDGRGEGEGEGDGSGEGSGEGQGQGQGQGQGEGQGSGEGGGSPSGQVAGATGGNGSGQGGQGTPKGSSGSSGSEDEQSRTDDPSVFDPTGGRGDELDLGGTPTGGQQGEVVGRGDGTSTQGSSFVPLSSAIDRFQQRVTRALDDPSLSPSMRELVRAYFSRLTEGT